MRELFFKAGAISTRQMPQDLLMNTAGDPGRRCYPLALLTASALAQGDAAERALIGRVANAGKTPADARARLHRAAANFSSRERLLKPGVPS